MSVCRIPLAMGAAGGQGEERIYLHPGSLWAGDKPTVITTVLGSCVSVCLWSDAVAGINHYILPRGGTSPSSRYGNHALPMLLDRMQRLGSDASSLYAAIFGGASLLGNGGDERSLGQRNLLEARDFLEHHNIPVIREDVGGAEGRKLTFRTVDGTTFVRKL